MIRLLLLLILFPIYSLSIECHKGIESDEMDLIRDSKANTIEFNNIRIPLPYRYEITLNNNVDFSARSRVCIDKIVYREVIKIDETKDCMFCNASTSDLESFNVIVRQKNEFDSYTIMLIEVKKTKSLLVWNSIKSLEIRDQNNEYLDYVINLLSEGH